MGERGAQVELDVLELWVGDLAQTTRVLTTLFGFEPVEKFLDAGPDEEVGCVMCGDVSLVLRQGTSATSPVARHVAAHGDGVADVALVSRDVGAVVDRAIARGLKTSMEIGSARLDLLGDGTILHSVRERGVVSHPDRRHGSGGLAMRAVDHVTYCLPWGVMDPVARSYREVLGLEDVALEDCSEVGDNTSGMRSIVLRSRHGFTIVLTEPLSPAGGQTEHFLRCMGRGRSAWPSPATISSRRSNRYGPKGYPFAVPGSISSAVSALVGSRASWEALRREEILVDAGESGLLLQLFTRPITDRSSFSSSSTAPEPRIRRPERAGSSLPSTPRLAGIEPRCLDATVGDVCGFEEPL
jgi:4-hydroxymandelate synthase